MPVLDMVMDSFKTASRKSPEAVMSVYNSLINTDSQTWETLSAISIVSSELFAKYTGKDNEMAETFIAINEMVDDFAATHLNHINDRRMFLRYRHPWLNNVLVD